MWRSGQLWVMFFSDPYYEGQHDWHRFWCEWRTPSCGLCPWEIQGEKKTLSLIPLEVCPGIFFSPSVAAKKRPCVFLPVESMWRPGRMGSHSLLLRVFFTAMQFISHVGCINALARLLPPPPPNYGTFGKLIEIQASMSTCATYSRDVYTRATKEYLQSPKYACHFEYNS